MHLRYTRLVETVRERTGTALRGVVVYRGDQKALIYQREDLGSEVTRRIHDAIETLRERDPMLGQTDVDGCHASVELYGDSVLVHLPEGEDCGTLLSLDPGVARQLSGFVEECTVTLQSPESNLESEAVPADG